MAVRIPADYFRRDRRGPTAWRKRHPALRLAVLILKNALGAVLVLGGVIMLFMPGQGLLTIFLGIVLMDFPGKFRLERYLISRHYEGGLADEHTRAPVALGSEYLSPQQPVQSSLLPAGFKLDLDAK